MSATETAYEHIVLDCSVPMIEGTNMKVVELVTERLAYGWSPEELHFQHPYLSLGQIHSALAFYWDHKDELDREIDRRKQAVEALQESCPTAPLIPKLRERGLI